jgi:trypsin
MTDLSSSFTTRLSVAVTKIIVHGRYDTKYKTNDIAMLKVSGNLIQHEEGTYSEKIEMAKKGSDFAGMPGTVTGYGTLTEGGRASSQLRTVNVQVMSNDKCRVYNTFDEQAMLCAGVAAGGKDSCQGDSGGPLVARQSNGKPVLIGVVSFGGGCARAGEPGVYARVSNYETLIKEIIRRY